MRDQAQYRLLKGICGYGAALLAISMLLVVVLSGCGETTVIRQTTVVTATAGNSATALPTSATATPVPAATVPPPPPGVWCLVQQGQMPLTSNCEIYPSPPQLYTPPQSETVLAGTWIGPQIGSSGADSVTENMTNPWAADVYCATNDNTNTGKTQIVMVAHTGNADFYSWGDESCGPPVAPSYGNEFFREATVSVTLTIEPLTNNLQFWYAQFIQL